MENLKNYSNAELVKELMNRVISSDEVDEMIDNDIELCDILTLEEDSTEAVTIKLWGPSI